MASASAKPNAPIWKRAIWKADHSVGKIPEKRTLGPGRPGAIGSGRSFHLDFRVEIVDDILERRDRLLDRRDLHQFPARNRAAAILQRDDEIAPLFLELNER